MDNYVGKMVQMDDTTYMIIWIQEIDNVIYGYLVNGDNGQKAKSTIAIFFTISSP